MQTINKISFIADESLSLYFKSCAVQSFFEFKGPLVLGEVCRNDRGLGLSLRVTNSNRCTHCP